MTTRLRLAFPAVLVLLASSCGVSVPKLTADPVDVAVDPDTGVRATREWNLDHAERVGLSGYDPVSYFPEGGGAPVPGDPSIAARYGGVVYLFATEANRAEFEARPGRYEPAYGGWCAYALAEFGTKYEIDPRHYVIQDGRLLLFYPGTEESWREGNPAASRGRADAAWQKLSGETP